MEVLKRRCDFTCIESRVVFRYTLTGAGLECYGPSAGLRPKVGIRMIYLGKTLRHYNIPCISKDDPLTGKNDTGSQ